MPRVPQYGAPLESTPLRLPNASPEMLNGNARLLTAAGRSLGQLAADADKMAQERAVIQAGELEARAAEEFQAFRQKAETDRRGEKAVGIGKDAEAFWADFRERNTKNVNGLVAQVAFPGLNNARLRAMEWAGDFERTHTRAAAETAFKASKSALLSTETNNPEQIAGIAQEIKAKNSAWAAMQGLGEAWAGEANAEDVSALHTAAVMRMARSERPEDAQTYYEQHINDIRDPDGKIKQFVADTTAASTAMQLGADLASRYGVTQTEEAIKELDRRTDLSTKQKDMARQELEHRHAVRQADIDRGRSEAFGSAQLEYERTGTISAGTLAGLAPEHQAALLRLQKNDTKLKKGEPTEPDYELFSRLTASAADPNGELRKTDLNTLVGRLEKTHLTTLAKLKAAAIAGAGTGAASSADPDGYELVTATQRINARASQLFPKAKQEKQRGAYKEAAYEAVTQFTAKNKRAPTAQELDKELLTVSERSRVGVFTNGPTLAEALRDPDKMTEFVGDIPDPTRKEIEAALTRANRPVTNAAIARVYAQYQAKNRQSAIEGAQQ